MSFPFPHQTARTHDKTICKKRQEVEQDSFRWRISERGADFRGFLTIGYRATADNGAAPPHPTRKGEETSWNGKQLKLSGAGK